MKRKSKKNTQGKYVNQCVLQENKSSINKWECQANVIEDDKNYQVNMRPVKKIVCDGKKGQSTKSFKNSVYPDKNCQESPNVHMWPVMPGKESSLMWSVTRLSNKKLVESASGDKNCQAIRCYRKTIQCLMTRNANLMCVLRRTVKIPSLCHK